MAIVKSELIKELKKSYPNFLNRDLNKIIEIILKEIKQTLQRGERVELRNFGSFSIRARQKRISRNPKTGSAVLVDSKYYPYFRSSKNIKELLNK